MNTNHWRTRYAEIREIAILVYDLDNDSDLPSVDEATLEQAISIAHTVESYYADLDDDGYCDGYDAHNRQCIKSFILDYSVSP